MRKPIVEISLTMTEIDCGLFETRIRIDGPVFTARENELLMGIQNSMTELIEEMYKRAASMNTITS